VIQFEQQVVVRADPATIFSIYEDVENWCRRDPDVESASIAGAFAPVTSAETQPPPGRSVRCLKGSSSQPSRSVLSNGRSWHIVTDVKSCGRECG